jgi:hypothetical protein
MTEEVDKLANKMDRIGVHKEVDDSVFDVGECLCEIDLIGMGFGGRIFGDEILGGMSDDGGQVHGENSGVKILIDREDGFTGPIFDLKSAFDGFVVFFDAPPFLVEVLEYGEGNPTGVEQGGHEDFSVSILQLDAKQANGDGVRRMSQFTAFGPSGLRGKKRDGFFPPARSIELLNRAPGFDGDTSAEMRVCGTQGRQEPKCGIASVKQDKIGWGEVM